MAVQIVKVDYKHVNKDKVWDMYITTYTNANQLLWFKKKEDLKSYDKYFIINNYKGVLAFRSRNLKVGLLMHDETPVGKKMVMDKLACLAKNNYLVEVSGAVSWILRKKYNLVPIRDKATIERLLGYEVVMNDDYDGQDKYSNVHRRLDYFENRSLFTSAK
jgi:hypothetical protein